MSFDQFFHTATGNQPYNYQHRLAGGDAGTRCESLLIDIPTGLGKTAAVVIAWLWNRTAHPDEKHREQWPRRLVYCLPMRTLVEQTADEVTKWLDRLASEYPGNQMIQELGAHSPIILMGGEDAVEWDSYPERPSVIIGTQDMLLSRALNRGYGMSRYRWPMHFGLLNGDCLWILDETQLMGSGLWTSAQLDWMRRDRFGSFRPVVTWWMSASLGSSFLQTQDRVNSGLSLPEPLHLSKQEEGVLPVLQAVRPVAIYSEKSTTKSKAGQVNKVEAFFVGLGTSILKDHVPGTLSLIVCNKVHHAQKLRTTIASLKSDLHPEPLLLTSRFRPGDRSRTLNEVRNFEKARKAGASHPGLILVATQVIEAGFDVSATKLWTEASPWPSMLQRLGRLNRDAKENERALAKVFSVPAEKGETGPYEESDIKIGQQIVAELVKLYSENSKIPSSEAIRKLRTDSGTGKLMDQALEPKRSPFPRASDVHGLFSTEPDVFGGFTDISPWVRNSDANADVTVFWRDFAPSDSLKDPEGPGFQRDEGCAVPVFRLLEFLGSARQAWHWDPKLKRWAPIRKQEIRPGMTLLLPASHGGYDPKEGWTGRTDHKLVEVPPPGPFEETDDEDRASQFRNWVPLNTHLADTALIAVEIAKKLDLTEAETECLVRAAELHDIGKSLLHWQEKLPQPPPAPGVLFAKAAFEVVLPCVKDPAIADAALDLLRNESEKLILRHEIGKEPKAPLDTMHVQVCRRPRCDTLDQLAKLLGVRPRISRFLPGLRHEAASALAMWRRYYHQDKADFPALAIYLVAAHHGKIRTALNPRANSLEPNVAGIPITIPPSLPWNSEWEMDFEAAIDGASGEFNKDGTFTFRAPGWSGLVADLLGGWEAGSPKLTCNAVPQDEPHALGPFALAYLETLLRACDGRASANPSEEMEFQKS